METSIKDPRWLAYTRKHLETVLANGVDRKGEHPSLMWYANCATPDGAPLPGGCSLYHDMPLLCAIHRFAELVGEERFARAADEYVRGFTERCLARTGLPLWGPHYHFDPEQACTMRQASPDTPPTCCDPETEIGDLHCIAPIPPAWEQLWRINPAIAEEAILGAAQFHLIDPASGQYSHTANHDPHAAILATGGILVEALAWLVRNVEGDFPLQLARSMANYAFGKRHATTGLLPANAAATDASLRTSTAELGIWAGCLVRAAALADEPEWVGMADEALSAWLHYGYNQASGCFLSAIDCDTGAPLPSEHPTLQPWSPDQPALELAEACFLLYGETEDDEYAHACHAWRDLIAATAPANNGNGTTAGRYGRVIHFLQSCSEEWPDEGYGQLAQQIANEAIDTLWDGAMFRSAPGTDVCRSEEGIGHLLLALLYLHTDRDPHMMGSGW
jgi:hypothetical protein